MSEVNDKFEKWHNEFYGPQDEYSGIRSLERFSEESGLVDSYIDNTVSAQFTAFKAAQSELAALREELANHDSATKLINAWVDTHGKQIPWDKAIEIIAVVTKMPEVERQRLLCMDDQYELVSKRLTAAEQRDVTLETALKFYADGDHLLLADPDEWDTCSGEPINWLHDAAGTASVEDGSVAKQALVKPTESGASE